MTQVVYRFVAKHWVVAGQGSIVYRQGSRWRSMANRTPGKLGLA